MLDTHLITSNPFKIVMCKNIQDSPASNFYQDLLEGNSTLNEKSDYQKNEDLSIISNHKRKKPEVVNKFSSDQKNVKCENESTGRWTEEEHELFVDAIKKYGKNWKIIEKIIQTRTPTQLRSHAQKFFSKIMKTYNTIDPINSIKESIISCEKEENSFQVQAERRETEVEVGIGCIQESSCKKSQGDFKQHIIKTPDETTINEEIYKSYLLKYINQQLIYSCSSNASIEIYLEILKLKMFVYGQLKKPRLSTNLKQFFNFVYFDLQSKLYIMKKSIESSPNFLSSKATLTKSNFPFLNTSFQVNDVFKVFKLKQYFT